MHGSQYSGEFQDRPHLHPLTRCNSEGVIYQRTEIVEAQIVVALALPPWQLIERAQITDYQSPFYLKEECLVYLIREYYQHGYESIVNDLSAVLLLRCEHVIKAKLSIFGPIVLEDARQDVIAEVFAQIVDLDSDRGDFLQVRFQVVLRRLVIEAFRRQRRERKQEAMQTVLFMSDQNAETESDGSAPGNLVEEIVAPGISTEEWILCRDALFSLDSPHRTAYVLRYYYGWPVEDRDPSVPTISRYFKKTSRTIRTWLREAEQAIERWRGEHNATRE